MARLWRFFFPKKRFPDLSGEQIGEYELIEELARSSTSVVYLVEDSKGKEYAMKILFPSDQNISKYSREVAATQILSEEPHCNQWVVCLKDAFLQKIKVETEETYYVIVMELMYADLLENVFLPSPGLLKLMQQLLTGLSEIHAKGIVHNNIKLETIYEGMLYTGPMKEDYKFGGLGFACTKRDILTKEYLICDYSRTTPFYVSPERAKAILEGGSMENITLEDAQENDVWALGVVFRLLADNTFPFPELTQIVQEGRQEEIDDVSVYEIIAYQPIDLFDQPGKAEDELITQVIQRMEVYEMEDRPTAQQVLNFLLERLPELEKTWFRYGRK